MNARSRRGKDEDKEEDSEDEEKSSDEDEDEDEDEEEDEEIERDADKREVAGPSGVSTEPIEQTRAERKAEKKQRKQPQTVTEEDRDLVNPNRLPVKSMAISDIAAPQELSRRERLAF